jgi:hypothetical protein
MKRGDGVTNRQFLLYNTTGHERDTFVGLRLLEIQTRGAVREGRVAGEVLWLSSVGTFATMTSLM